jgi:hypothetical protein
MGSENAHRCAQKAGNGLGFDFCRAIPQDGGECLIHIILVTGAETLFSFVNVETKEQSKPWMHTHICQTSRKGLSKW